MSGVTPYFHDDRFLEDFEGRAERFAIVSDATHVVDYVDADSWLHAFERWLLEEREWTGYDRFAGRTCPDEPFNAVRFGQDTVFHTALIVPAEALEASHD